MRLRLLVLVLATLWSLGLAGAAPVIYWASDPVQPGETVLVAGEGLSPQPTVLVRSGSKSLPTAALQPTDTGLKFVVPAALKPGLLTFTVKTAAGSATHTLNRPALWWWRGDLGVQACPGGELRLLGRNLALPGQKTTVSLQGPKTHQLAATGDAYATAVKLPAALPAGKYAVSVHNGYGASEPVTVEVRRAPPAPALVLNVRDFGADGTGQRDNTAALQAALDKAGEKGGTVLLPRGRYQITDTLRIPRFVTLRGEKQEWVALFWPDFDNPPEALVRGTNSFALAELTLYASNHRNVIQGDLGTQPDAGNVTLRRVRVRANAYRGHITPEQVDERFRQSLKWSTGGGDTVQLGGENVVITDCDLYGGGRSLYLSRARHSLVANNDLYNGRWGWYCLEGSDGLIFEHNRLTGADLMSTGGGIANYSTACSRNIYYSYNDLRFCHGWDREVMTTDAGGEAYFGKVASADGAALTLGQEAHWGGRDWTNGGVFLLDGKGAGQWRFVKTWDGAKLTVDRPWQVVPDATTTVGITMFHGRYAFVGNRFTDCGAFQFYGTSIECDVVGNTAARNQGYQALGLWYHGFQPSWYCQFLGNTIAEGNYYHWTAAEDAVLNVYGARREGYDGPLVRGAVLRGNRLAGNAHISVSGTAAGVLVENNEVASSEMGIFVSQTTQDVLLRGNRFRAVTHEVLDEPGMRKAAQERLAKFLDRPDPVAVWNCDELVKGAIPDASGNNFVARLDGGVTLVPGGQQGQALRFDGTGYLQVNEPAVFNAPNLTVAFWLKPETLRGRRGLIVKRFGNSACPFVIGQSGAALSFEATDEQGKWSFNFLSPAVLKENQWTLAAVVMKQGEGVTIYADGQPVAQKPNPLARMDNAEPLILGREAWGGDPPTTNGPGLYVGLLDGIRIWTRALSPEEVAALK